MAIFQISLPLPNFYPKPYFCSCRLLSGNNQLSLLPLRTATAPRRLLPPIRMGGGPRTFPGGVSKWQWKRMQAKKAKQLLKARLARERQVYEMRKRAELKAAVADLERPWETVQDRAPKLFSASADEQLKVLADRFQRPGGFDMWSERDGPQLFSHVDGLPSARFFPKGAVHSIKPYGKIGENSNGAENLSLPGAFSEVEGYIETNGHTSSGGFKDNVGGEVKITSKRWIENTGNRNEKWDTDGKFKTKPCKKTGGNSIVAEKLFYSSSDFHVERDGYKNLDRVGNNLSSGLPTNANKWIKNSREGNEKIGSSAKFTNKTYQRIGKNSNISESLSLPSSISKVVDDNAINGSKNLDKSKEFTQTKVNKWVKKSMDRNEKSGSRGRFRSKTFGKFGSNANDAGNLSRSRSFSGSVVRIERNGYKKTDRFSYSLGREGGINANKSTPISMDRNAKGYNNGKSRNKVSTRRFQNGKSVTSIESRGLISEVYNMDLREDGSYGFES